MLIYLQMIEDDSDKDKFEKLYLKYRNLMHYVAFQILHNPDDAEDAVHNAFVNIAKNIKKISTVDCLETRSYIVIIVENIAIDMLRRERQIFMSEYDDNKATNGYSFHISEENPLYYAMAKLSPKYREILLLRFGNGYSQKELCKLLDMSPANVQRTLYRAKEALRKQLEEESDS